MIHDFFGSGCRAISLFGRLMKTLVSQLLAKYVLNSLCFLVPDESPQKRQHSAGGLTDYDTFRSSAQIPKNVSAICRVLFKSDGQEISTIEWQELKNEFRLFSDYKKLLRIEEI